ncbi:MAG TPA: 2-dehydropantoate 2-reductase [Terriglobales bacterium]|nr:2-dehydropantoate 2-reductase [Terriglobales bacterium]
MVDGCDPQRSRGLTDSTSQLDGWPRVAVVGAGAVGGYFGGLLALAGAPVVLIARPAFVDAVNRDGLFLDTLQFQKSVHLEATTDFVAVRGADLVLFCVKTVDNAATARAIAPLLGPETLVVGLQNGVDNAEQIRAAAQINILPAVVYIAASVEKPGCIKHVGRGDLVLSARDLGARRVAEIFTRANIPCRLSDNIEGELWTKLIWNCALNAISALARVRYGEIARNPEARKLVRAAVEEVLAVAHAANVVLPDVASSEAALAGAMKIATQMPEAFSSTAQDIHRGKLTEIDSLNGYIARRGAALGVPTPVNHTLFTLVKMLEGR